MLVRFAPILAHRLPFPPPSLPEQPQPWRPLPANPPPTTASARSSAPSAGTASTSPCVSRTRFCPSSPQPSSLLSPCMPSCDAIGPVRWSMAKRCCAPNWCVRNISIRRRRVCSPKPACTQLAYLVLLALRVALAAEWALSPVRHVTAIAAAVVAAVEVIPMAVLSYYDHARSLRPSTLLGCYLLTTLMFDIARVRTLWLMHASSAVTSTFTAAFSLKALALVLETIEKRRSIVAIQSKDAAPEETSGPLNRAVFWWVNPLLVVGCRRDLSVIQLPSIGLDMDSETIHHSFESAWAQRMLAAMPTLRVSL